MHGGYYIDFREGNKTFVVFRDGSQEIEVTYNMIEEYFYESGDFDMNDYSLYEMNEEGFKELLYLDEHLGSLFGQDIRKFYSDAYLYSINEL